MHRVAQRPPFGDGQRCRLLQVDVLAGLHGVNRQARMLVIGRTDDDGIDVAIGEQFAIVGIAGDAVIGLAGLLAVLAVEEELGFVDALAVEIARRHDARRLVLPDPRQIVPARDPAGADGADIDAVARRRRAKYRRGNDGRKSGNNRGGDSSLPR